MTRLVSILFLTATALGSVVHAQADRVAARVGPLVAEPDLAGTWKCHFQYLAPAVPVSECTNLVDALVKARATVQGDGLEGLVREEQGLREYARKGGREKVESEWSTTLVVATETKFYEREDSDGGWQEGGSHGQTRQVLRTGDDLVWSRADSSKPAGFAQPFGVARVSDRQGASNSLLACEARQHVLAINYCARLGSHQDSGDMWIVGREDYAKEPPVGLALLYVGTTMTLTRSLHGPRTHYVVTMFDHTGRTCKQWLSEWVAGRPRTLEARELFSVGSAVNVIRILKVIEYDVDQHVLDVVELAMTPFEKRVAKDHRQRGTPKFDPTLGLPKLDGAIPAPNEKKETEKEEAPKQPTNRQEMVDPPVGGAHSRNGHGIGAKGISQAVPLTAIPVHPDSGPAVFEWPWLVGAALVAGLVGAVLRRRRARRFDPVASALVAVLVLPFAGCADGSPSNPVAAKSQAIASPFTPVEVVPSGLQVKRSGTTGEVHRYELCVVNNLDEPVHLLCVLPSCGCVRMDAASNGIVLQAFDGHPFQVWIEMDKFVDVDLKVGWRPVRAGTTGGTFTVPLRSVDGVAVTSSSTHPAGPAHAYSR